MAILAPLAVVPDAQGQGIGGALIEHGLSLLQRSGVGLVFVLGHPGYYPRHGFEPAGRLGFDAPFPILDGERGRLDGPGPSSRAGRHGLRHAAVRRRAERTGALAGVSGARPER